MRKLGFAAGLLIGGVVCFSPVAQAQWAPIPPPRYEAMPPPPGGPRMVWQGGAWDWTGHGYAWRPGHYVVWQPHHVWIPGHWARHGTVWVGPHWR